MPRLPRRDALRLAASLPLVHSAAAVEAPLSPGRVVGQPEAADAGMQVLSDGGNAADAAVAAALVSGVVAVYSCGIGGYGGHAVIGTPDGKVTAVDFNSTAPAATTEDMFPVDAAGQPTGKSHSKGWLAAGIPGTLAGLQLILEKFGTQPLSNVLFPAIRFANDGFTLNAAVARAIKTASAQFALDAGSAKLYLPNGEPRAAGTLFRNPDLARMLESLAADNSVESFYRGKIAAQIAAAFKQNGGIVTGNDLAAYQARVVPSLTLEWNGSTVHTAPLTAGGLSVLQALGTLKALEWDKQDPADPKTTHARIEALRVAWHDRLTLLGDPLGRPVPVEKLLSTDYAAQTAARVRQSVKYKTLITGPADGRDAGGTVHLSVVDRNGMFVALTLTHGEAFGAQVTVDGLGLTLGHGMSRFEARAGHPNSPRPGCRPLNNMCPTVITRGGKPVIALGAVGGRRIPNTIYDILANLVGRRTSLEAACAAPRMHTIGDATLDFAKGWSETETNHLKQAGYTIRPGNGANPNAVERDPESGATKSVPK
jgi:gamma-glutamyltranspeptidase / glutathione hydrolase